MWTTANSTLRNAMYSLSALTLFSAVKMLSEFKPFNNSDFTQRKLALNFDNHLILFCHRTRTQNVEYSRANLTMQIKAYPFMLR